MISRNIKPDFKMENKIKELQKNYVGTGWMSVFRDGNEVRDMVTLQNPETDICLLFTAYTYI